MRKHMWAGVLFAVVCLYFAFRGISLSQLWRVLLNANGWPILLALGLYFLDYYVRSIRWAILIRPIRTIPALVAQDMTCATNS